MERTRSMTQGAAGAGLAPVPCPDDPEAGFMLVAVVVMVVLVLVALSVAAPVIARDIRRDKEVESEHRMQQYVRAIRLYYRKNGNYPASLEALGNTNNVRYLRKTYVDPLTGQSNWRLLHQGEQKTKVSVFFGQPLDGMAGMSGGLGSAAGSASPNMPGSAGTSSSTIGSTSALASGFSGATIGGSSGTSGTGSSTLGSLSGSASSSMGGIGGGPIIGVGTAKTGASILTPNGQKDYHNWEFWYDPRIEQLYQKGHQAEMAGSSGLSSTPASSMGQGINGTPNSPGGTGTGSSVPSGFPSSPSSSPSSSPTNSPTSSGSGYGSSPQ